MSGGNVNPIDAQSDLKRVDYPATKQQIIDRERQNGADDEIIQALERIPDKTYDQVTDVSQALTQAGSPVDHLVT